MSASTWIHCKHIFNIYFGKFYSSQTENHGDVNQYERTIFKLYLDNNLGTRKFYTNEVRNLDSP